MGFPNLVQLFSNTFVWRHFNVVNAKTLNIFRPISNKWQVFEVTHRGLKPISNIFGTCTVLSLPPDTGAMQSQVLSSNDLYRFRMPINSSSLCFQSIIFCFQTLRMLIRVLLHQTLDLV
jgi:hypothetical protein